MCNLLFIQLITVSTLTTILAIASPILLTTLLFLIKMILSIKKEVSDSVSIVYGKIGNTDKEVGVLNARFIDERKNTDDKFNDVHGQIEEALSNMNKIDDNISALNENVASVGTKVDSLSYQIEKMHDKVYK